MPPFHITVFNALLHLSPVTKHYFGDQLNCPDLLKIRISLVSDDFNVCFPFPIIIPTVNKFMPINKITLSCVISSLEQNNQTHAWWQCDHNFSYWNKETSCKSWSISSLCHCIQNQPCSPTFILFLFSFICLKEKR